MITVTQYLKGQMSYRIEKYQQGHYGLWNDFVSRSKNGTFLFQRGFMEYHSDRFKDFSLLIFEGNIIKGLFPANIDKDAVYSHQGLTYGGLVLDSHSSLEDINDIFEVLIAFLKEHGVSRLFIKYIPYIYNKRASHEFEYLLFNKQAQLYRKDLNLAIDYSKPARISKSKLKHFRRISGLGLEIRQDTDFRMFWDDVLIPRLKEKHNVSPVHSKEEIQLLHDRFPENILQYNAYYENEIVAGITLFNCGNVVKSQYGATTDRGEKVRALDFIFITLIEEYRDKSCFFDMGTVTEAGEKGYNPGLLKQKQELGCNIYTQDFYLLQLDQVEFH